MPIWISYAMMCLLCFGFWGFFSKMALDRLSPDLTLIFQTLGIFMVTLLMLKPILNKTPFSLWGGFYAVLTGIAFTVGSILFFMATKRQGNVSVVVTMTALYPLVTIVLSCIFLHESLTMKQGAGMGMAVLAMILLVS